MTVTLGEVVPVDPSPGEGSVSLMSQMVKGGMAEPSGWVEAKGSQTHITAWHPLKAQRIGARLSTPAWCSAAPGSSPCPPVRSLPSHLK